MELIRRLDCRGREPGEILQLLGRGRRQLLSGGPKRKIVDRIIADVAASGDAAVAKYTLEFDGISLSPDQFAVPGEEWDRALASLPGPLKEALELAASRIREYEERNLAPAPAPLPAGSRATACREFPLERAGIYVPGGTAAYPSSVLMNALPARVAGVKEVVICTPPGPNGEVSPAVLAAARLAGADALFRVGGAQAIGALALGTETIPAVDKIAGPGNIYVTLAKQAVFGLVDIDQVAGPSEVLIIADGRAEPGFIAADLMAQAEHDALSVPLLVSDDESLLDAVAARLETDLADNPRREIARQALARQGALLLVENPEAAADLADRIAPEHLEIIAAEPEALAGRISRAGAVFLGPWTPEAAGDYVAGPSHTLPTAGTARFFSGLSARAFRRRSSLVRYDRAALAGDAAAIIALAEAEGLPGHAASVRRRLEAKP